MHCLLTKGQTIRRYSLENLAPALDHFSDEKKKRNNFVGARESRVFDQRYQDRFGTSRSTNESFFCFVLLILSLGMIPLVKSRGYEIKRVNVTTEDGYILGKSFLYIFFSISSFFVVYV